MPISGMPVTICREYSKVFVRLLTASIGVRILCIFAAEI
jgi:hypothetical protein